VTDLPTWDETTRPPVVTYADTSSYAGGAAAHLRAIHDHYRHGLAVVADVVDQVVAGTASLGDARAALHETGLTAAYQRLGSFCGQLCHAVTQHHMIEDVVLYPQLRAADGGLTATIDRLDHEHRVIHDVLERIDLSLVTFASERGHLDQLATEVRHLRTMLESHFAYEEDAIGTALGVHRIGV
jgi:hypothetical protein